MLRRAALFLISFLLFAFSDAQPQIPVTTEVHGRVIDAVTKQPMSYVTINVMGTDGGALTEDDGEYYIRTTGPIDSIMFSFLAYDRTIVRVKRGQVQEINVELKQSGVTLQEAIIRAPDKKPKRIIDTAAMYVYHKVVANKRKNSSDNLNTYKYESYEKLQLALLNTPTRFMNFWLFRPFKFVFDNKDSTESGNEFIPGLLKETLSDVYYRRDPRSERKYIKADMLSGINNVSIGNLANYHFADINAYDNLIVLAGAAFTGPFAGNANVTYIYTMMDTLIMDDRITYKLNFVGKVKEDLALKGYVWIDSATWAIRSISFRPNEKANMNFVNDYTIKQDYTLVKDSFWIKNRDEMTTIGSIFKKKNKMAILVTKIHDRRNFEIDIAIPDTVFKGLEEEILLDSARQKSYTYWDSTRFEPLTRQEEKVYYNLDSIKTTRTFKVYQSVGRFATAAYIDAGPISIGRILNFVSRNNVEGWRLRFGFETNPRFRNPGNALHDFFQHFHFTGYMAYGLKDKDWKYQATMRLALPKINDRWQSMDAMYRYDMRIPGQDENQTVLTFDNVFTLLSGTTMSKIMKVREARIGYEKEWTRGFSTNTYFTQKTYYSIPGVFDFRRKVGENSMAIANFSVSEFMIDTRMSHKDQYYADLFYRFFQTTKFPVFMVRYTLGMVNMQGNYYNYHNFHFTVKQRLSSPIGHTNYILKAGKIFGKVPYTAAYMTQGNLGYLFDKFNYGLLRESEFINDQYVSLWVEHHFDGFFLNKIPGVNKAKLREVIFARSLIGSFNQKNWEVLEKPGFAPYNNNDLKSTSPMPYVEAGFGIENIFYLLRVDLVWRLTYRDKTMAPTWGIKFAISPAF